MGSYKTQGAKARAKAKAKAKADKKRQLSCKLLQLPRELRDRIWITVLSSTRLTFGERSTARIGRKVMKTAPHSLSILRLCKQINEETKTLWLKHVLFNFEQTEAMLHKLSNLSPAILSQIRYMRISNGGLLMLSPPGTVRAVFYRPAAVLKLLPGLCLNRLTVLSVPTGDIAYDALRGLVQTGTGWKELHYITPHSIMLGYENEESMELFDDLGDHYLRKPQPTDWNETLCQRDGARSEASVTIYRSTIPESVGTVMNPSTRDIVVQNVTSAEELATFGRKEEKSMTSEKKELLVVVKRGRDANVSKLDGPPYGLDDIRNWASGMTWAQINKISNGWMDEEMAREAEEAAEWEAILPGSSRRDPVEIDTYNNVDDYVWPVTT